MTEIDSLQFSVFSPSEIVRNSQVELKTRTFYTENKIPETDGPLNFLLGPHNGSDVCSVCKLKESCPGHFGHINLVLPVFHIGYFKHTYNILNCVCLFCGDVLHKQQVANIQQQILESRKIKRCFICNNNTSVITKINYKLSTNNRELNPAVVLNIFKLIKKSHYKFLFIQSDPTNFLIQSVAVLPNICRPSVKTLLSSNEDDITIKLAEIVQSNNNLQSSIDRGCLLSQLREEWDYLALNVNLMISGEYNKEPLRGIVQRLKGKHGRFRGNLSGKRVDFSGRTVISPDPCLTIEEVGVPEHMCRILTVPEVVTKFNIEYLQRLVNNYGSYPSANYVTKNAESNYKEPKFTSDNVKNFYNNEFKRDGDIDFSPINIKVNDYKDRNNVLKPEIRLADSQTSSTITTNSQNDNMVTNLQNDNTVTNLESNTEIDSTRITQSMTENIVQSKIQSQTGPTKIFLKFSKGKLKLECGDIVDRHLQHGDIVLFNRQPSLHRISIMGHKVVPHRHKTLRFNECVCTPYNADFDGDEMNIHVPQTLEAQAESRILLNVASNLCTPRSDEPLVACTQDFITAMYLLTDIECFVDRNTFAQLCASFCDFKFLRVRPAIVRPAELFTGKQVFNVLLRESLLVKNKLAAFLPSNEMSRLLMSDDVLEHGSFSNHNKKEHDSIVGNSYINANENAMHTLTEFPNFQNKNANSENINSTSNVSELKTLNDDNIPEYDFNLVSQNKSKGKKDSIIVIKNGFYYCGQLDKSIIGSENKSTSLIYALIKYHTPSAIFLMNCIAKLSGLFLSSKGFTIGLDDVEPDSFIKEEKQAIVDKVYSECNKKLEMYFSNNLPRMPGCTPLQTVESILSGLLSKIRDDLGNKCILYDTAPVKMQAAGSKGSKINVVQMVACVGQQIIGGKRISDGFVSNVKNKEGYILIKKGISTAQDLKFDDSNKISKTNNQMPNDNNDQFNTSRDKLNPSFVSSTRTLPHFSPENSLTPIAKGFVKNSFFSGLKPSEFYFHAASGREGLVDTAVKTAETGYMQRRLMKALEDIRICYDRTVRNAQNEIIQFSSSDEPGTAIGAITGQSIGEPGTQMTLKTFHFAGVASMNITLGVPRLKEIINGTANINTPLIKADLVDCNEFYDQRTTKQKGKKKIKTKASNIAPLIFAQQVKARIERTFLKDVCTSLTETYGTKDTYLTINICKTTISNLLINVDAENIKNTIANIHKIPIDHISVKSEDTNTDSLTILCKKDYYAFKQLRRSILNTLISGKKSINRVVVNKNNNDAYNLLIEGNGLHAILSTTGVKTATTNNILEIAATLGIEAARKAIIHETKYTMDNHGINIDNKHLELLADTMTFRGSTLGITRFGIGKMKMSTLMLASFEQTSDHLFNAAAKGTVDDVKGVSECIILGKRMDVGTGVVELVQKT